MKKHAVRIPSIVLVALAVLVTALPAAAQTRISLDAGGLLPVADMADAHDLSPYVGARWEVQATNALGQISTRTWFLRFGYGLLQTSEEVSSGADVSDGYFLDACIGGRAYAQSKWSPLFVSVSGGYAQYEAPGFQKTFHGGTLNGGMGARLGILGLILEAEVRGHLTILDGTDNIEFFTGIVSIGIPL